MSTTDVAGSVTPVYTPTLPVTNDASILTQADLTATVLSLANRIEYVKQLVDVASENFAGFQDDFLNVDAGGLTFGSPRVWHGDTPWLATQLLAAPIRLQQVSGGTVSHGILNIDALSGASGVNFSKLAGAAGVGSRASSFLKAKCIVRAFYLGAGMKFEFGLQASGGGIQIDPANAAAASFIFDPVTYGPNWMCKTSLNAAASAHYSDSGVPVNLAPGAAAQKLEIERVVVSLSPFEFEFRFSIQGSVVVTKNSLTGGPFFLPSLNEFMQARVACNVPDLTILNETFQVDYVTFLFNAQGR
jgi:hypothetical protein